MPSRAFPPGIHGPSLTFFKDDDQQDIDWDTQARHLGYMVTSGMRGVVLAGSSGESCTLTLDERAQLVRKAREIAQANGRNDFIITVGCHANSTRGVIEQTVVGHQNGADFALVLVPCVFSWAMTDQAIVDFFTEVADRSPIPVVIYNFPKLVAGLDVNSDMLETLGVHPNICGVKLTCGGIAKVTRVAARFTADQFGALSGMSDWLVPALSVGAIGCISGAANIFPRVLVEIYNLYTAGKIDEATELQKKLGKPEWGIGTSDVNGMKWTTVKQNGYPPSSAHCRRPFPRFDDAEEQARVRKLVALLAPVEEELRSKTV
ncbi:dihydrodipicolinate synthase family protein [Aspergillus lucknowensis]|uniref:Dihydrodipicolinate synthetase family protein n=1 Tax=Aspergillus lucknowensis TaxID=176173 RepID=A0ABR4LIE9_9EURO